MGIKFDKDPLSVERNNYLTKIVHFTLPMLQMLDQEFLLKIWNLSGGANTVKNSEK